MINDVEYIFGEFSGDKLLQVEEKLKEINHRIRTICNTDISFPGKSVYYLFPYLFAEDFKLEEKEMQSLCTMSVMCLDFCLFSDKFLDRQINLTQRMYYHKILVYQQFIKELDAIGSNEVMTFYDGYFREYVHGTSLEERYHFGNINEYTWEEFVLISQGKQALAKIIPTVMACKTNEKDKIVKYEHAMNLFSVALQLYDDLKDWKEDFELKRFSWLLTRIIKENCLGKDCSKDEVRELLYKKNYDINVLDIASNLCEEAIVAIGNNDVWSRYVRLLQIKINRLMGDFIRIKGYPIESYAYGFRNHQKHTVEFIIKENWRFLLEQYKNGLSELKHWMFYTVGSDKNASLKVLPATIFQRACMLNLILELRQVAGINQFEHVEDVIDSEVSNIIHSRTKKYDCGWTYCEGLYGNCPDLDTLSEIIRINNFVHNETLSQEINKVLNKVEKINVGNVFSSWIIVESDRDYEAISKLFSKNGEVDVNANFMAALHVSEGESKNEVIQGCLEWINSMQKREGYWESNWYVGNYYCGYVLSKTFHLQKDQHAKDKYLNYLFASQNDNGSWGSYHGNPLCSSYAIMTLINIGDVSERAKTAIRKEMLYLLETVNTSGYWYGCEFIKMGPGKESISEQAYRYRSATLTTMYCMSALYKGTCFLGER